jgi:hypothetical protein
LICSAREAATVMLSPTSSVVCILFMAVYQL